MTSKTLLHRFSFVALVLFSYATFAAPTVEFHYRGLFDRHFCAKKELITEKMVAEAKEKVVLLRAAWADRGTKLLKETEKSLKFFKPNFEFTLYLCPEGPNGLSDGLLLNIHDKKLDNLVDTAFRMILMHTVLISPDLYHMDTPFTFTDELKRLETIVKSLTTLHHFHVFAWRKKMYDDLKISKEEVERLDKNAGYQSHHLEALEILKHTDHKPFIDEVIAKNKAEK